MGKQSSGQSTNQLLLESLSALGIKSDATKMQSHGMTVAEMKDLRIKLSSGEELDKVNANQNPEFKINAHEQHLIHVFLKHQHWEKGKDVGPKGRIQKFYSNDFDQMSKTVQIPGEFRPQNAFAAFDIVKVIHDPRKKTVTEVKEEPKAITEMSIEELRDVYEKLGGTWSEEDTEAQLVGLIGELQAQ